MKLSAKPFYRPASSGSPSEDGVVINEKAGFFAVCDGVSGPYSPSNPGLQYEGGITGGQMVSKTICGQFTNALLGKGVEHVLSLANRMVLESHLSMHKNPKEEAVAGACAAACHVGNGQALMVLIGDCFVFYKNDKGFHFLTNFDQAAFDFEEKGNEAFVQCLQKAGGDKKAAWDLYFPYFSHKQFFRANKNLGAGGHAVLNGDSALLHCWTAEGTELSGLEWMLLGTDGLLTADSINPKNRKQLEKELGQMYSWGGLAAIIAWRDEKDFLPHISGHPEASAIEIKFKP